MSDVYRFNSPTAAINEVLRLVNEDCAQPNLALNSLAGKVILSNSRRPLIQTHTGQSFRHYLRDVRIQKRPSF